MIVRLSDRPFDHERLLRDYANACMALNTFTTQLNVVCPENIADVKDQLVFMAGTNWDYEKNEMKVPEQAFTKTCDVFSKTYTESVIEQIREDYTIGRVRFLVLNPKTTYTWHKDLEEIRLHIPLKTSMGAFFIWLDREPEDRIVCQRMRHVGHLYSFKTTNWHTAVNADTATRIHLVVNVLEDKN